MTGKLKNSASLRKVRQRSEFVHKIRLAYIKEDSHYLLTADSQKCYRCNKIPMGLYRILQRPND